LAHSLEMRMAPPAKERAALCTRTTLEKPLTRALAPASCGGGCVVEAHGQGEGRGKKSGGAGRVDDTAQRDSELRRGS
jgi:hypothetical protein